MSWSPAVSWLKSFPWFFEFWAQYAGKVDRATKLATKKFITAMAKSYPSRKERRTPTLYCPVKALRTCTKRANEERSKLFVYYYCYLLLQWSSYELCNTIVWIIKGALLEQG
jgi:hypothetical protein